MIKYLSTKCKKYKMKILKKLVNEHIDTLKNTIYTICDDNRIEILVKEIKKTIIIDIKGDNND